MIDRTKKILNTALVAIVLIFVIDSFSQNWPKVTSYVWNVNYATLALSVVAHLFTFVLFSWVWCWLLTAYGHNIRIKSAFKIGYLANLGRYIPGKIWPVFGMAYLAEQVGVKKRESVSSWIVALVYANMASLIAAMFFGFFNDTISEWVKSVAPNSVLIAGSMVAIAASAVLLYRPDIVSASVNKILKIMKREPVTLEMSRRTATKVFFGYMACWILYGFAFWLFAQAMLNDVSVPFASGVGSFIVAYQVGYLAFFSPGGIGVRELTLVVLLQPSIGDSAFAIALAARLWNMAAEVIAAVIALKIRFR